MNRKWNSIITLAVFVILAGGYGVLMIYDATHPAWEQATQPRNQWGQLLPNNIDELCEGTLLMWSKRCKALVRKQSYRKDI